MSQIISGKSHNKYRLNSINTDNVLKISEYLSDPPVRGAGGYDSEDIRLIIPDEKNAVNLEEGVWFTGIGIVDNELHIQIRYDDINLLKKLSASNRVDAILLVKEKIQEK